MQTERRRFVGCRESGRPVVRCTEVMPSIRTRIPPIQTVIQNCAEIVCRAGNIVSWMVCRIFDKTMSFF